MKKTIFAALLLFIAFSCKDGSKSEINVEAKKVEDQSVPEMPVEVKQHIKKIEKKEYTAENNYGSYVRGVWVSTTVETFTKESLIKEVAITINNEDEAPATVYTYNPKLNEKGDVELYNDKNELIEVEVNRNNTLYSYEVGNPEEPTLVRKFDEKGNHLLELSNQDGKNLFVTTYDIKEKDENGFATKANAIWIQYKKPNHVDFYNLDFNDMEVISKAFQIVEFKYDLYE